MNKFRNIVILLLVVSLTTLLFPALIVNADSADIDVKINGASIEFDQPPIIEEGRTLVPMRAIFEALGAEVVWDGDTQTAIGTKDDIEIRITIDNNIMYKNGTEIVLDTPSRLVGDRTLVPVRAIAESFGAVVDWDEDSRTVQIYHGGIIGTWLLAGAELEGLALDATTLASFGMDEMTLTFRADGIVALRFGDDEASAAYIENGDEIEISEDGEVVMSFVNHGDALVCEEDGLKMIFTKSGRVDNSYYNSKSSDNNSSDSIYNPPNIIGNQPNNIDNAVGTWLLISVEFDDIILVTDELAYYGIDSMTLDLKPNGIASFGFDGDSEDVTYVETENRIDIYDYDERVMTFVKIGDTLVYEEEYNAKLTFARMSPVSVVSVIGTWSLSGAEINNLRLDEEMLDPADNVVFEFKQNGVVTFHFEDASEDAEYVEYHHAVYISIDGEIVLSLFKRNDTLVLNEDGIKLIFSK